jgi:hypothetical protein
MLCDRQGAPLLVEALSAVWRAWVAIEHGDAAVRVTGLGGVRVALLPVERQASLYACPF